MANSEYKILLEKYTKLYEENIKLKLRNTELEEKTLIYKENTDKSSTNFIKTEEFKAILEENVRLKERILQLESAPKENINLSIQTKPIDNSENETKIRILTDNNSYLNNKIGELESEIKCLKERINNFKKISIGLFGYTIKYEGNVYRLTSAYAFDDEDEIVIELIDKKCNVQANAFFNQWKDQFKEFVLKKNSWSAFFAHVTLSLFNQKTFG